MFFQYIGSILGEYAGEELQCASFLLLGQPSAAALGCSDLGSQGSCQLLGSSYTQVQTFHSSYFAGISHSDPLRWALSRPGHRALARSSLFRDWFPCAWAVLSLAQTHRGRPQTTSTRLYAGGELQGSPVWQALAGHKRSLPLAVVLPPPARGPGTLIPSAQRLVWAAKQPLGKAALGALFA